MSKLLEELSKETKVLKKQQENNLKDFTEKFRKLDKDYKALLKKRDNILAVINEELAEEKAKIKSIEESLTAEGKETKRLLNEAETVNAEALELKAKLEKDVSDGIVEKNKASVAYAKKSKVLIAKVDEAAKEIECLKGKHRKADETDARNQEDVINVNKRIGAVSLREDAVENRIKKEKAILRQDADILVRNQAVLDRATDVKTKNDEILRSINQENAELIKKQEDIAHRERNIEKEKEAIAVRAEDIKIGDKKIKKRLAEAEVLYKEWKTKLSKMK